MTDELSSSALAFLQSARVGHLATVDAHGRPAVVPVCFAFDSGRVYTVIDAKPKRLPPERLLRVRNLAENPHAALVVDRWDERWERLGWVLLRGEGEVIEAGAERSRALELLRGKYSQYRAMELESAPVIRILVSEQRVWGDLGRPQFPILP